MDSSDPNRNPSSDVSSKKNIEDEKVNLSPESRTEEEAPAVNASPPEALALMPQPLDDREYGCKYCNKKFSNKQALGGHQNAHKVERAMEKTPRDPVPEGHFPYGFAGGSGGAAAAAVGGDTLSYTGLMMMMGNPNPSPHHHHHHFLGSSCNNRSHEFVNRSTTVNWPYSSSSSHHRQHHQQQQQQQQQLLNQRQALQIRYNNPGTPAFVAPRPLPGYSNVNSGWTASRAPAPGQPSRVSNPYNNNNNSYNYPGQPSYMQNQNQAAAQVTNNTNLRLHPMTTGGSGGPMRPGSHQGFGGGPRIRPGNMVNPAGENRNTMMVNQPVNEQVEDSDMDLSLKL